MRDVLEDAHRYLNDNKFMSCHNIISALANELVNARCEIERLKQDVFDLQVELNRARDK